MQCKLCLVDVAGGLVFGDFELFPRADVRGLRVLDPDFLVHAQVHQAAGIQFNEQVAFFDVFALVHNRQDLGLAFDLAFDHFLFPRLDRAGNVNTDGQWPLLHLENGAIRHCGACIGSSGQNVIEDDKRKDDNGKRAANGRPPGSVHLGELHITSRVTFVTG